MKYMIVHRDCVISMLCSQHIPGALDKSLYLAALPQIKGNNENQVQVMCMNLKSCFRSQTVCLSGIADRKFGFILTLY